MSSTLKYELTYVPLAVNPLFFDKIEHNNCLFITRYGRWTDNGPTPLNHILPIENKAKAMYILDSKYFYIVKELICV
jgi:hypothetical protein